MNRYYYVFGCTPSWSWAWDDMDSEILVIDAENETAALEYGNKLAACIVTHCWPELPDQQIKGFLEDKPSCECELTFTAPEIPTANVWREWEEKKYGDSFATRISKASEMKFQWAGLKGDDFTIASLWIPHREREVISWMNPGQHFILSACCLKSFQDENGGAQAPSQPLYALLQALADNEEQNFSPISLRVMYQEQWRPVYSEILQKLRRWEFDASIYIQAKTEELLLQIDQLLRAIIEEEPTLYPALAVWEMTQRYQNWELNQSNAFKNSGIAFFPLIAKKDDESQQRLHWIQHLTPPPKWKIALLISCANIPCELWIGAVIMPMVAIYAAILYFLPTCWQWPIFVLLVILTVTVSVFGWNKYHKHKPEAGK